MDWCFFFGLGWREWESNRVVCETKGGAEQNNVNRDMNGGAAELRGWSEAAAGAGRLKEGWVSRLVEEGMRRKRRKLFGKLLSPDLPGYPRPITVLKVMIVQIWTRQLFKVPSGRWANVIIRLLTDCVLIRVFLPCSELHVHDILREGSVWLMIFPLNTAPHIFFPLQAFSSLGTWWCLFRINGSFVQFQQNSLTGRECTHCGGSLNSTAGIFKEIAAADPWLCSKDPFGTLEAVLLLPLVHKSLWGEKYVPQWLKLDSSLAIKIFVGHVLGMCLIKILLMVLVFNKHDGWWMKAKIEGS